MAIDYDALRKRAKKKDEEWAARNLPSNNDLGPVRKTAPLDDLGPVRQTVSMKTPQDIQDIFKADINGTSAKAKTLKKAAEDSKRKAARKTQAEHEELSKLTYKQIKERMAANDKEYAELKKKSGGGKAYNKLIKTANTLMPNESSGKVKAQADITIKRMEELVAEKEKLQPYYLKAAQKEKLSKLDNGVLKALDNINDSNELEDSSKWNQLLSNFAGATTAPSVTDLYSHEANKNIQNSNLDFLYKKGYSYDEIKELADLRKRQVNEEIQKKQSEEAHQFAKEHPVQGFVRARSENLLGGITGSFETARQILDPNKSQYGIDQNAAGYQFTRDTGAIDEQIQLDHDWKIGGVDAFDMFYGVGASVVDNTLRAVVGGGSGTAAGALMSGQVLTQSIIESKDKGYSDSKALSKALVSATIEGITEKYSLETVINPNNAKSVMGKIIKSAAAEGSEEVASNWLNNIYEAVVNGSQSDIEKTMQSYIDGGMSNREALIQTMGDLVAEDGKAFLIGALSGGIMGGGAHIMQGGNKLSKTEKQVVDAETDNRIKEEEQSGNKLSNKEKKNIRKDVITDLEKGRISTDTIESVLGGETYNKYKNSVDSRENLKKELAELRQMKSGEMNDIQKDRLAELKAMNLNDTSESDNLKSQLENEVYALAKESNRLNESYNEKSRRRQNYEADISKYDKAQQETIKNAVESGVLNNTNRTHEFVDMIAKVSAEKGVLFDFTDNEKLKASGFALEGKGINGYVSDNKVTVNIHSAKVLNAVVGHEITHILEGTEHYAVLQEAVKQYAQTKGEYDARLQSIAKMYEGVEGANIDNELTADLIGDYLFTDDKFIESLSSEQPNLFKKIFNEIKYFCKTVTAGSKEAKQLLKVQRAFEKAYQNYAISNDEDTKYSLAKGKKSKYNKNKTYRDEFRTNAMIWANSSNRVVGDTTILNRNGKGFVLIEATEDGYVEVESGNYQKVKGIKEEYAREIDKAREISDKDAKDLEIERRRSDWGVVDSTNNSGEGFATRLDNGEQKGKQTRADERSRQNSEKQIIPSLEENSENSTKYSVSNVANADEILYNKNNPLSVTNRAKTDNKSSIKWVYDAKIFSIVENKLFHEKISEINQGSNAFSKTANGEYMIPIENKIVFTDGNYDSPQISEIVEVLTDNATEFDVIKETICGVEAGKLDKSEEMRVLKEMFGTGSIISYKSGNGTVYGWEDGRRKGKTRRTVIRNYINKQIRTGNAGKSKGTQVATNVATFSNAQNTNNSLSEDGEDIKFSLSDDIAPVKKYGNYNVYGKDIALEKSNQNYDIAPIGENVKRTVKNSFASTDEDIAPVRNDIQTPSDDIAPIRTDIKQNDDLGPVRDDIATVENTAKEGTGQFSKNEISKIRDKVIKKFNLNGLNDYIHVQKQVLNKLRNSNFFNKSNADGSKSRNVTVKENGMLVEINAKGIKETFGKGKRYEKVPSDIKVLKIDVVEQLPAIIENATVTNESVTNSHKEKNGQNKTFTYLEGKANVEGKEVNVRIALKKSAEKSKFWIHYVDVENKKTPTSLNLPGANNASPGKTEFLSAKNIIAPIKSESQEKSLENDLGPVRDDIVIVSTEDRIKAKLSSYRTELANNEKGREKSYSSFTDSINEKQTQYDNKKNKNTKAANKLLRNIETLKRRRDNIDADYQKRISDIKRKIGKCEFDLTQDHTQEDKLERRLKRIDNDLASEKEAVKEQFMQRAYQLKTEIADKNAFVKKNARALYDEFPLKKGVRVSKELGYLLDQGYGYNEVEMALAHIAANPEKTVNPNSIIEEIARQRLDELYEDKMFEGTKLNKEYTECIKKLENEADEKRKEARRGSQYEKKHTSIRERIVELLGDTSYWKDKRWGGSYSVNTLRRNLRDIVRDENGNRDIKKADEIFDYLQGSYNHNEALLKKESRKIKETFAEMDINKYESVYIQMLGEFRSNPDTELTQSAVDNYLKEHKDKIDTHKVERAIDSARETYNNLIMRVNAVLRDNGMKEIPYRKGYFPHFNEEKQGRLAKLLNWKIKDDRIPTDIAGLTEQFNPIRSYQSFDKTRIKDDTEYNFLKGLDTYVHGALDWIYHIEDIQRRREFENEIRYRHSEKGVQELVEKVFDEGLDADETQERLDGIFKERDNPLNNFVTDFRKGTQTLAGKKSTYDREMEYATNRKVYSTMTNITNRVSANMIALNISSALTNFIPITQSWGQVSPVNSMRAAGAVIKNAFRNDGMIEKSDFLTNRLIEEENLNKTAWEKISDKAGLLMNVIDNFTSQVVWRSKYIEDMNNGINEAKAIKNADMFAENVIAGRSRGNMPTVFDAKNPVFKMLTAFQLEVNNQYGYMFKDMPQEIGKENIGKLVKGYATMFVGAYVYNALYSMLTGRDAAFDPVKIISQLIEDLDLGDDDEEDNIEDAIGAVKNLGENVLQEMPFVGGILGGGRVPLSNALPYGMSVTDFIEDVEGYLTSEDKERYRKNFIKEFSKPLYYIALPLGGGQISKTINGLKMFDDDLPISGSYTDSGDLKYPVEKTPWNVTQAALFGQYANKNAREYFDNDIAPIKKDDIELYKELGLPIDKYREIQKELKKASDLTDNNGYTKYSDEAGNVYWYDKDTLTVYDEDYNEADVSIRDLNKVKSLAEQLEYIDSLPLSNEQKNLLYNDIDPVEKTDKYGYEKYTGVEFNEDGELEDGNYYYDSKRDIYYNSDYEQVSRSSIYNLAPVKDRDMSNYSKFSDYEAFDFYNKNPEKYKFLKNNGISYEEYTSSWENKEAYDWAYEAPERIAVAKVLDGDIVKLKSYTDEMNDFKADKDSNGKSITGSKKKKILNYVNALNEDYYAKLILFKMKYPADDTYNYEIIDYLNEREDVTYSEMETILKELGFKVNSNGNITW